MSVCVACSELLTSGEDTFFFVLFFSEAELLKVLRLSFPLLLKQGEQNCCETYPKKKEKKKSECQHVYQGGAAKLKVTDEGGRRHTNTLDPQYILGFFFLLRSIYLLLCSANSLSLSLLLLFALSLTKNRKEKNEK